MISTNTIRISQPVTKKKISGYASGEKVILGLNAMAMALFNRSSKVTFDERTMTLREATLNATRTFSLKGNAKNNYVSVKITMCQRPVSEYLGTWTYASVDCGIQLVEKIE